MNSNLQRIFDLIKQSAFLSAEDKATLEKAVKDTDKELEILWFKLDRTEKVKHTTAILLEETIEELEQKRKAVEAQNRELEIESSLERVRTVAMSMNKPDDMLEVCTTISLQLQSLGVKEIRNVQTAIFYEERGTYMNYEYYAKHHKTFITEAIYTDHEIRKTFAARMLKGKGETSFTLLEGEEKVKEWLAYQKTTNVFIDTFLETASSLCYYWFSLGPVALCISTYVALSDDELSLFKRFLNVFELAYRRFLDIEQAVAQAKEAKIEVSLERVRSRAMAMQNSGELGDLVATVFTELTKLDFAITSSIIWIHNPELNTEELWAASPELNKPARPIQLKSFYHPFFKSIIHAWKERDQKWIYELTGVDKQNFEELFFHDVGNLPEALKTALTAHEKVIFSASFSRFGAIEVLGVQALSDEKFDILHRIGRVFDLSYTRFNDLKQAEAQAREARIEVSLERVRSRAMAMQKSEDLAEAVAIVFNELDKLELGMLRCGIGILDKIKRTGDVWYTIKTETGSSSRVKPGEDMDIHPMLHNAFESWLQGQDYSYTLENEDLIQYYKALNAIDFVLPELQKTGSVAEGLRQYYHVAMFQSGGLFAFRESAFPEEAKAVMRRFADVFNLTYTRFQDLQKAEAQAREAQIELALERVRARTMAMQKSDELAEAAQLLYHEFGTLGINTFTCGYLFIKEEKNIQTAWAVLPDGTLLPDFIDFPLTGDHVLDNRYQAWKEQKPLHICEVQGEANKEHHRFLSNHVPASTVEDIFSHMPERIIFYCANFSNGYLFIIATEFFSPDEEQTIIRFAKVFEQTYIRFLDLQKAEAQAREAQIEAALERVRSRTMGMQKSEELKEVIQVVYDQFVHLNILIEHTGFILDYKARDDMNIWLADRHEVPAEVTIPYFDCAHWNSFNEAKENGKDFFANHLSFEEKNKFYQDLFKLIPGVPEETLEYYFNCPGLAISTVLLENVGLYIENFSGISYTDEENNTLMRFGKVFQQTYTRFLDLQKAEAQTREAKIEAALERVRSRSMAMHKSNELLEVINVFSEQLQQLNIKFGFVSFGFISPDFDFDFWLASPGLPYPERIFAPYIDNPIVNTVIEAKKKGVNFFTNTFSKEDNNQWLQVLMEHNKTSLLFEKSKDFVLNSPGFARSSVILKHIDIFIGNYVPKPYTDEENEILIRFANVFEQSYVRFLDLQKAEAQAREAQIEASLERVRSKAMAMQKSEDLAIAVGIVFEELDKLNIGTLRCGIAIIDKDKRTADIWSTVKSENGMSVHVSGDESMDIHPMLKETYKAWLEQKDYEYVLEGEDLTDFYRSLTDTNFKLPEHQSSPDKDSRHYHYMVPFQAGSLYAFREMHFPDEAKSVMKRFADVFNLTYTRFQDLQKAESQAREAQIEASLERIRSQAMAMRTSDDLSDTVKVYFKELKSLGMILLRCGVAEYGDEPYLANITVTSATTLGDSFQILGRVNQVGHPVLEGIYEHWVRQEEFFPVLQGRDLHDYNKVVSSKIDLPDLPEDTTEYGYYFYFKEGSFFVWAQEKLSEDSLRLFRRFTSVLSLTYRRYLDLVEAETQAKEAIIDAALEKVRGRAMAMHNSSDLSSTASMVFTELRKLGIDPIRSGVALLTKENRKATIYAATSAEEGDALSLVGWVMLEGQPVLNKQYESWLHQEDYFPILKGKELIDYYEKLTTNFSLPDIQTDVEQHGYYLPFRDGFLYCWTENLYTETQIKILNRFKAIIDLTFRRYIELQKSEANARDAVRQASLDRVRAEIASMRTMYDLEKITPLIWNELTILGVPFIRCGVFIMDEAVQLIHTFLSTPDGKAIAAFHLPYTSPGNIAQMLHHWQKNENYIDHWDEAAFKEFAGVLAKEGALTSPEQYLSTMPKGGFYLHFLPFLQGMLYVGNTIQLKEDEIQIVQSVASAFSTAYARYEDFNKLESAKQQVENTLSDLKLAQQQLIQSEKMASLGELTAGIAHEIQNPLNFVNNFSEVNAELIEEMKHEIAKENLDEVIAIANDIKDNQEKITHHGKRADAIVKGMLQHSRMSTGVKEPTDINALADEYLRLAYHGLRAKDKSFNATMKTDFDESIGLINIVPQDIGRVILNLITNAFYAVAEKKKQQDPLPPEKGDKYEPSVTVSTKKLLPPSGGAEVEVSVKDNGNGIPKNALDKIFQPFFTTKPTGQGTGLGLSLSYDIVKAHGGELKVETKENEGTTFTIYLPVT